MKLLSMVFFWLLLLTVCKGYRILGVFPFNAKSHFMMFERLMKGLADKGHQVDVISTFPLKKPHANYRDLIVLKSPREFVNNLTYADMLELTVTLPVRTIANIAGNGACEFLGHPDIQKIVREPSDPPYDAVVMEVFGAHCYTAIGHILKIPTIGVSSSAMYPWFHDMIGNPENVALVATNLISLDENMNFWDRLYNFLVVHFNKLYFNHLSSAQDDIIKKHLGHVAGDLPSVRELERRISLIIVNSHPSFNGLIPATPALIEVGGLHVNEEGADLSPALEKWMNESTDGIVYFTFGSMVKIESFPPENLKVFYKSLGKIAPVRVLMKIPDPGQLPPGLPKNILTAQWMPQVKVLKHRNVRAFITHGGLMGTQEAIHCGVPMIGIPLFADQFVNIDTYVRKKIAVKLDINGLTEEKMDAALDAILNNPIYRETARNVSRIFLDRPMKPIDTANFWVEYVIRNGPNALRSPAMNLAWWQVALLDVYAFILLVVLALLSAIVFVVKRLFSLRSAGAHRVPRTKKIS